MRFVSAGMSEFYGYKLWEAVLRELAVFILIEGKRKAALKKIDDSAYEKAAQMILEAYPTMLNQLSDLISPNKFNTCPPSEVRGILARSSEIFNRYPPNLDIQLDHAQTWFNLTLQQREADISATVTDIVDFLRSNTNIIPQF